MPFKNPQAIERKLQRRLEDFDLPSLLRLLAALGWRRDEILFVSNPSTTSQRGLLHNIAFHRQPRRQVRITLNIGLLAAQSPLPSYFFKRMDHGMSDVPGFIDFIHFFDHRILSELIDYIYPEANATVFGDFDARRQRFLGFMNLRSSTTLHWLLRGVFPELGVLIEKVALPRLVRGGALRLGSARLGGDAVFGAKTKIAVSGKRITLHSASEDTDTGVPWAAEIRRRLRDQVFPLLAQVGLDVEIFLLIESERSWAELRGESYLGYDRIRGGEAQERRLRLFSGKVTRDSGDALGVDEGGRKRRRGAGNESSAKGSQASGKGMGMGMGARLGK